MYYCFTGVWGILVLAGVGNVRVLDAVGIKANQYLDTLLTGLILMGGAEQVGGFLKGLPGAPSSAESKPVEIRGKLTLEEGLGKARSTSA